MNISERELENYLMENGCSFWYKDFLRLKWKFRRQFNISPYGIIDIIAVATMDTITVGGEKGKERRIDIWELKNEHFDMSQVTQLYRYVAGIQNDIIGKDEKTHTIITPHLLYYQEIPVGTLKDSFYESMTLLQFLFKSRCRQNITIEPLHLHSYYIPLSTGIKFDEEIPWRYAMEEESISQSQIDLLFQDNG